MTLNVSAQRPSGRHMSGFTACLMPLKGRNFHLMAHWVGASHGHMGLLFPFRYLPVCAIISHPRTLFLCKKWRSTFKITPSLTVMFTITCPAWRNPSPFQPLSDYFSLFLINQRLIGVSCCLCSRGTLFFLFKKIFVCSLFLIHSFSALKIKTGYIIVPIIFFSYYFPDWTTQHDLAVSKLK